LTLHIKPTSLVVAVLITSVSSCNRPAKEPLEKPVDTSKVMATKTDDQTWSLEEADREYLWDLEHHSNLLVKFGFGTIAKAIQDQDQHALRRVLADDFVGQLVGQTTVVQFQDDSLVAHRRQPPTEAVGLTQDQLVSFLLNKRQAFSGIPKVRFDVKVILPRNRENLDAEWDSTCVMRMWGETEAGPAELSIAFDVAHERPTNARMQQDAWIHSFSIERIATSTSTQHLFREASYNIDRKRLFDNWTTDNNKSQNTGGIYACDFNRDGCIDLFITDINPQGTALYRGLPEGGLEDVTDQVGLAKVRKELPDVNVAFVDLDGDGWEDLVFARGVVFRNFGGRRFANVTPQSNLQSHTKGVPSSSISVADFDCDGKVDLYVTRRGGLPTSWLEDTKENRETNLLLKNKGGFQFEDVTVRSGTGGDARSTFTSLWLNANQDVWPDLYVINEFGDGSLYINETGGCFRQIDVDKTTDDFGSMGATCGDIDNDGNIDLYNASMYSKAGSRVMANLPKGVYPADVTAKLRRLISGSEFYQNEGLLKFTAQGENYQVHDVGWAWGPTLADFNNDGWLDLFATAGYMSRDRAKPDG